MADLHIKLLNKNEEAADTESAKVYPWIVAVTGNQGLPSKVFDCVAFVAHEITNNRLLRNSLTRDVRLRVKRTTSEVILSVRYNGEPFNDLSSENPDVPRGIQHIIKYAQAVYGPEAASEGETTGTAGEALYTTAKINFPI